MMFLRADLEGMRLVPEPKSHVVYSELEPNLLPAEPPAELTALIGLVQGMHHELQAKDREIANLNFELGKYQEVAKNSVPLLEAAKKDQAKSEQLEQLKRELSSAHFGKYVFLSLFGLTLGALGVLINFLFIR